MELVEVDTSKDSSFAEVLSIAQSAAAHWYLSSEGPYAKPHMTPADAVAGAVRDGLLHLLELGLVDIDVPRLTELLWYPANRHSSGARGTK